jgi:DNA polymerase-4
MFMAKQRCPHLEVVSSRKGRYSEVSLTVMAILNRYSPVVEQVSIDEAYLDAAGCARLYGPPDAMANAIKKEIRDSLCLTCSIGVAPLKFLAKIASDMNKPDGLTVIAPESVADFISGLPVEKVPGVGKQAFQQLKRMGILTLGDVRTRKASARVERLGKFGYRLMDLARGRDETTVCPHSPTQSISTEKTLSHDTRDREQLNQHLLSQSQEVARNLRRQGFVARTITLKLKNSDFRQITRSATLDRPIHASETIYETARTLLARQTIDQPIRLIGVGASALIADTTPRQASLFSEASFRSNGWEKVDRAMDRIAERFGTSAVRRGSLAEEKD